jgi:hypothetical protein
MPGSDLWIHKSEIFLDDRCRDAKCEGSDECECEYGCEPRIANCDLPVSSESARKCPNMKNSGKKHIPRYFPKNSRSQEFPRLFENALQLQDISGNGQKMPDCKKMLENQGFRGFSENIQEIPSSRLKMSCTANSQTTGNCKGSRKIEGEMPKATNNDHKSYENTKIRTQTDKIHKKLLGIAGYVRGFAGDGVRVPGKICQQFENDYDKGDALSKTDKGTQTLPESGVHHLNPLKLLEVKNR